MAYKEDDVIKFKEIIIDGISNGKSLKSILDNDKKLPTRPTVYNWLNKEHSSYDESFLYNYVRAREESADLDAEKIQELAEKTLSGEYDASSARVALDAYKWSAGKKQPKKYGDRLELDVKESPMTPEERKAKIAELKHKLNEK